MVANPKPSQTSYSTESLSDRIRPYLDEIASRAVATEKARMVPKENIELIRNAGFVRAFVPTSKGGDARSIRDYCEGVRTIAKACPSTGWVTGVLNVHPAGVLQFSKDTQEKVWEKGADTIICSSGSAVIKAKLVEGGILVNGTGRWSSGCDHAEWAMVGVKVPDITDPEYPERNYRPHMFMVHKSEYEIEDQWHSTGMRGSGSKNLVFKDLFVPYERLEGLDAINLGYATGENSDNSWISQVQFSLLFSVFLPAVALGCADGMMEEFTKRQKARKNVYSGAQGILNPAGYMRLVEAKHELEAISEYYYSYLDQLQASGVNGEKVTEASFFGGVSKLSYIATRATKVIDILFEGAGASAIADFNPMQRYWRDGHTARLHQGMDHDLNAQNYGRHLMGLPPTPDL